MTKIHIPPAALEAGWKAVANGNACCRTSEQIARAALEAMVAAWPMMHVHEWQRPWLGGMSGKDLILPLPQENTDAEA